MLKSVLIVDDSLFMRALIKNILETGGYRVIAEAETGEEAIDMAFALLPDIITLDNILPDMMGTDILKVYMNKKIPSKIVMISAIGQQAVIDEGLRLGAKGYLVKPFTGKQLLDIVEIL